MKVAVIGAGYWGPNLIRNFLSLDEVDGVVACDVDETRLARMRKAFYGIETSASANEAIDRPDVDIVVIATPVSTHYELAKRALTAGKHCFIEKPMTASSREAEELIELADTKNLKLFVDHTFIYTGAVRKMKEMITSDRLGELYYFDSVRVNLGLFQHDVNVIWDLAPHDLSIADYLLEKRPLAVSAVGTCHVGNGLEDIAYLTLQFENNLIAHFHVNWLAPMKIRRTLIGGTKSMIVYDDTEASEKVKVYNKGIDVTTREGVYDTLVQYRTGDMLSPKLDQTEALAEATRHFIDCILNDKTPITDGLAGLNVVRVLEASGESISGGGRFIEF
ncbi:MAG TPA: Gfo/Idh/MocA family oxidoreductase [Pyrinomonadaceae bacterium]|jgi:predicted dehydrogenase|nr:Gfo/Idh/MocA family oxidoreductase [Pyrinomonadaceae bacterium]